MQIMRAIGMTRGTEEQLSFALTMLSDRHARDADIRDACATFATWCEQHLHALAPIAERYGEQLTEHPLRLRAGLFYGSRMGGIGLLQDLQDVAVLAQHARLCWTTLAQAAAELRDAELQRICLLSAAETDRQIAWIQTHVKNIAPQALTVTPHVPSEMRASMPPRPTLAAVPDGVWGPIAGGALLLLTGLLALAVGEPWLVPSLGPTAYLQAESPAQPSARAYNAFVGHLVGLLVGFGTVWALGVRDNRVPLSSGELTAGRVVAAAVAVALTILIANALHASHPPAGATALLVALGSIHNQDQALYVMLGVLVLAVAGEIVRHIRLGDAKTIVHARRPAGLVRLPRMPRVLSPHA